MNQKGFSKFILIIALVIVVVGIGAYFIVTKRPINQSDVFSANPTTGSAPLSVNFTIAATDSSADSGIYYTIVFGDGEAAGFSRVSNPTLSHTYAVQGIYTATITRNTQCSLWECLGPSTKIGTIQMTVK